MNNSEIIKFITYNYDIEVIGIAPLAEGVTDSFLIESEKSKIIFKLVPKSFKDTVRESLNVLVFLENNNYSSPKVVLTRSNELSICYKDGALAILYHYIEGKDLGENINYEELGKLVGRLHKLMDRYAGNLKKHRKNFFIDRFIKILEKKKYNINKIDEFKKYGEELWKKVENLPMGFCHGDLHKGNIIEDCNGKYHILDFDTSCYSFPIYDIMILCNSTDYFKYEEENFEKTNINFREFLKGYEKFKFIENIEKKSFYYFIGIYHYQLQATIIEIYGLDCVNDDFLDNQLNWLMKWKKQSEEYLKLYTTK